ncbi:hypothetical protein J7U39_25650 (plasmid) [Rhizobium sp. NLR16a]|nr:hypothetical protein J7U39_25650 [Rhizobium sp. NLR16a]
MAVARNHGIDIAGQRARRIRSIDFVSVDLIVAMDRDNVAELNRIAPPEASIQLFGDIALGTGRTLPTPMMAVRKVSSCSIPSS